MNKMFGNAITTMPQLAAAVIFAASLVLVYGLLSMFLIGPSRAAPTAPPFVVLAEFPTLAECEQQKNWRQGEGRCLGVDAPETTDDSITGVDDVIPTSDRPALPNKGER